jgi:hypothetical protein
MSTAARKPDPPAVPKEVVDLDRKLQKMVDDGAPYENRVDICRRSRGTLAELRYRQTVLAGRTQKQYADAVGFTQQAINKSVRLCRELYPDCDTWEAGDNQVVTTGSARSTAAQQREQAKRDKKAQEDAEDTAISEEASSERQRLTLGDIAEPDDADVEYERAVDPNDRIRSLCTKVDGAIAPHDDVLDKYVDEVADALAALTEDGATLAEVAAYGGLKAGRRLTVRLLARFAEIPADEPTS